ncbi:hypothetical protein KCV87_16150 [Actinosynnema pretiosum subsp. pretiosum]|uniref:Uncharacterized protein n=2 Tax=Actinosynnema TaxID=40566 RepID=C6WMB5_ACTMD|nr:hypothetical protein [Actinosynnema mirum]ACU34849.1 hypothetical protein Amir_0888 [Actinosynnema mirum DSM 43827]AXX28214.1 hypothetical protein APASM_0849 [Actinosynnema pretiosum subsp. pretiosum]QUF07415.1 hypothetical protein KCV87_16150 [Actinosynnema pretiosum subsp. pretiosum]
MPIRTNRGRAAVYRRLWGWPLRSPNHLAMTVVGFAALVVAASVLVPQLTDRGAQARQGGEVPPLSTSVGGQPGQGTQIGVLPTSTTAPPQTKEPAPTRPSPATTGSDVVVPAEAQLVVESWLDKWADHPAGTTNEKWLKGLEPFTSEELLPNLKSVDPALVPVVIKGEVKRISAGSASAEFEAEVETGKMVITVVKFPDPAGWRVHKYDKVG